MLKRGPLLLGILGLAVSAATGPAQRQLKGEKVGDGTLVAVLPPDAIRTLAQPVFVTRQEADQQMADNEPVLGLVDPAFGQANAYSLSHQDYAAALAKYVDERGMVNYRGLKASGSDLDAFAASLSRLKPEALNSLNDREKIAFWINAYNALTLEVILRNYPIKSSVVRSLVYPKNSIRQIPAVWDNFRFVIAGREMSLNDIEHATLRDKFHEPRIHVALVCAAMSCPPLRNEPYIAEKLDSQLDDQARKFLRSPRGFRIDRDKERVYLSSIFKWFPGDFRASYGASDQFAGKSASDRAVLNFASRYVSDSDRDFLLHGTYKLEYLDYDWSLNEQKSD